MHHTLVNNSTLSLRLHCKMRHGSKRLNLVELAGRVSNQPNTQHVHQSDYIIQQPIQALLHCMQTSWGPYFQTCCEMSEFGSICAFYVLCVLMHVEHNDLPLKLLS